MTTLYCQTCGNVRDYPHAVFPQGQDVSHHQFRCTCGGILNTKPLSAFPYLCEECAHLTDCDSEPDLEAYRLCFKWNPCFTKQGVL